MRLLTTCLVLFLAQQGLSLAKVVADDGYRPNFVVIFCDDLGYGDLACFGHPTIATPNLDRMAAEGMKFTQFYAAAPVCTPSRAALMTGRLPLRNGMCSNNRRVLFPDSKGGLPAEEITIAEALQANGYSTACVGKWHLGHLPEYLPTNNGFDYYFGIPYSNDMDRMNEAPKGRDAFWDPEVRYWNVPLMRNTEIIERPADQTTITRRYTDEATKFIRESKDSPFFLYLPHSMPHVPLFCSSDFSGKSRRGLFGDVIEEIDWSVGQVLDTLRELELDSNTLVVFTSDNGPWLIFDEQGGSAGLLRDGKGSTWEGGMREPTLAWWPGQIKPGTVSRDVASTMDLFATFYALAGINLPTDRVLDSHDLTPVLKGTGGSSRETLFYYRAYELMAVRKGPWKMHRMTQDAYGAGSREPKQHDPPLLYNLEHDPGEKLDVASDHADVIELLRAEIELHQASLIVVDSQLER
ncbi:MAG TPA: sulfatase [Pirellulaceae bacterium]|mgnify:CR=1 FL=1|nr:sulfatase [Pirellulaceae bacterium]